ncbi:Coatomer epsilon subunit [Fagus crenata]
MAAAVSTPDHLFNLRNNFFLGAYQAAINLSPDDIVERDYLVYRSYIAPGSYQLVIHEIDALHRQHRLRSRPSNCSHSFSPPLMPRYHLSFFFRSLA